MVFCFDKDLFQTNVNENCCLNEIETLTSTTPITPTQTMLNLTNTTNSDAFIRSKLLNQDHLSDKSVVMLDDYNSIVVSSSTGGFNNCHSIDPNSISLIDDRGGVESNKVVLNSAHSLGYQQLETGDFSNQITMSTDLMSGLDHCYQHALPSSCLHVIMPIKSTTMTTATSTTSVYNNKG